VTPQPCPICRRKTKPNRPADDDFLWECSHIECPSRRKVTAAPNDQPPPPKENQ